MEGALDLMRRMPPKHIETALSALLTLLPHHSSYLLCQVDQPLQMTMRLPIAEGHLCNMGKMIEEMEGKLRNSPDQVYFGKTKEMVCTLRPPSEVVMKLPNSWFSYIWCMKKNFLKSVFVSFLDMLEVSNSRDSLITEIDPIPCYTF